MDPIGGWRKYGFGYPIGLLGWLNQACLNRMASIEAGWVGRLGTCGLGARLRQGPGSIPRQADFCHSHPVGCCLPPTPIETVTDPGQAFAKAGPRGKQVPGPLGPRQRQAQELVLTASPWR
jgi:hypothetical protein